MNLRVFENKQALSDAAAAHAATIIRHAIDHAGLARVVAATGASQFEFLDKLTKSPGIDWQKVELFQLDEYVGLPATHPASFTKYLEKRLVGKTGIARYHALSGEADPAKVIRDASAAIAKAPVDVAFAGIGENGHLAFNDPPADFETSDPYILVNLDEACRRQQVGEGWFSALAEVPRQAISMSIRQILKAKEIIAVVPDARKAQAVKACFEGDISPIAPASILRTHANASIFLDRESSALLSGATLAAGSTVPLRADGPLSHSRVIANSKGGK
ncbi:MAG: glucosamine-6-phosphate deaminase [Candidatus Acidiferrum sp.]